ncbi:JAB-like toxin 1 domain-containing protein [Riemerella anatipestifer]|nr:JAB-like toxin 1 domain-containing protein [Riemerella anatipestifer]
MYCQTVIKNKNKFRGFVGSTTETRRSDDGAVRSKKRLPKWQKGKFTKHYFEGTSRIMSKLGEGTFHQPSGLMAGGIDYIKQSAKIQEAIDQYIKGLNIPPGPPTQHGIYGTPDFTGQEYPSIDWSDISQDQEPPEGWPRPPKFNEPGDVPGPPVQYGDPVKPETVEGGFGFKDNGVEEKNLYFYHPDHLGSSSYITDANGDINQHTEYMAFGEVLFDEHKVSRRMPYLFNGKELDSETGLYYYGARYYDPKTSIWLNVDPLAEKYPFTSPYTYTLNNPINLIDPTGMEPEDDYELSKNGVIRLIRRTDDKFDRLFTQDGKNSISINKKNAQDGSIISELSTPKPDSPTYLTSLKTAKTGDVSIGKTNKVNDAVNLYNFLNANTEEHIEYGLFKYDKGQGVNYLIATQREYDTMSKAFKYAINNYIEKYNNLIAFIHNHDGYSGSHPEEIGNQWSSDQGSRISIYNELTRSGIRQYPRFMTVHEGLGNTLIELNKDGHKKTNLQLTPNTIKNLNKIQR